MDFVFNCASCHGPLVTRRELRGVRIRCAHCSHPIEFRNGRPVAESVVNIFLDLTKPGPTKRILRRVRPASFQSSAGRSHARPNLARGVRITHVV